MTTRNLDAVLRPRSVAVIGASERPGSIGRIVMQNLAAAGFAGAILPVNPKHAAVFGLRAYPDVRSLPSAPDLAVVAIPAAGVPAVVAELAARGTRGAVVISAGFGGAGGALEQAMLDAARPALLRIVGPNTLGAIVPGAGLDASFAHVRAAAGGLAFVTQSGAVLTSILDWAVPRGIGFSHLVALGDMADVDFGDMLDYLANDGGTRAILLYIEAITQPRKFMSAARAAARVKPVIVVKGGTHAASAGAAASHTGRLAGPDAEYAAAFRRAGLLRVATLDELFSAVETLALARPPSGRRLAIVTNGGGLGVLAADALLDRGGELAPLDPRTIARLDAELPAAWSHGNPVDIVGDATPERYAAAVRIALDDPNADALLVLYCPTAVTPALDAARAVAAAVAERPAASVLTSWLGEHSARGARAELQARGVPTYDTPEQAVQAFMQMVDHRHNQELLLETPPAAPANAPTGADVDAARRALAAAARAGRRWLEPDEVRAVLGAYGIAATAAHVVDSPRAAGEAAERIGGPVALKISSDAISHKSDVGGVVLGLTGGAAVEAAASAMLERVRRLAPGAAIRGFSVEPMVERTGALELIVGAAAHGDFGPVILFGEGGTAVEAIADTALELPPLNLRLARELIGRTRIFRRMRGYRGVPPVDVDAVAHVLLRVSQLLADHAAIVDLDINPLLASASGAVALDARIGIALAGAAERRSRFAIGAYPRELERRLTIGGRALLLRPILPEDEPALRAAFARLGSGSTRERFFAAAGDLPHAAAARLTQIDYDREMTFVLTAEGAPGSELLAAARVLADPDGVAARLAIFFDPNIDERAAGHALLERVLGYARSRGLRELGADVPAEAGAMQAVYFALGFVAGGEPGRGIRMTLDLDRYIPK